MADNPEYWSVLEAGARSENGIMDQCRAIARSGPPLRIRSGLPDATIISWHGVDPRKHMSRAGLYHIRKRCQKTNLSAWPMGKIVSNINENLNPSLG